MPILKAPVFPAYFRIGQRVYAPDAEGLIAAAPEHEAALRSLGCTDPAPAPAPPELTITLEAVTPVPVPIVEVAPAPSEDDK